MVRNFLQSFIYGNKDNNKNSKDSTVNAAKGRKNTKAKTVDVAVGRDDDSDPEEEVQSFNIFLYKFKREATLVTREVVASSFTSIFSVLFSHPFDVIKSEYQLLRYPRTVHHALYFKRRKFLYVLRNIYETKGLTRFYKYHMVSQRESLFQVVSMFWTYQRVRQFFDENFETVNDNCTNFFSGFFSATIPVMVIHPYDEYRERQGAKQKVIQKYGEIAAANLLKDIECMRPMFRNCFSMFVHMGTQYGLRFMFYNKIRDEIEKLRKTERDKATDTNPYVAQVDSIIDLSSGELLIAGALAAILGDAIAHPLDVVRSRLAMKSLMRQQYRYDSTCRQFFQCIKIMLKQERLGAFYAGITPCIIRSAVNTALQFAAYDKVRDWLRPLFPA